MEQILNKLFAVVLLTSVAEFASCTNPGNKSEENAVTNTTIRKEEDIAELTAEQIKAVGIEMGTIEQRNLTNVVKASGQLAVPPQNKALVNALVGGVIRKINVVEGQAVKKGQVVVIIENPDFIRLQHDYLRSKDNLVYLEQEYERQKQLKEADAGIGKIYQQASANYAAEKSKLLTLEKQLQQIHVNPAQVSSGNLITQIPVLAPISGTIGKVNLSIGTYTDASNPIMEIINNNTIYCDLLVYEKDIAKVKVGQRINFTLTSQNNKQVSGQVYGINKGFQSDNKAVVVHAILNNVASLNLIPGMYVSALIETGKQFVSALPNGAIVKANDKQYIFVLEKIEKEKITQDESAIRNETKEIYVFKKTEVITGVEELGYTEIRLLEEFAPDAKIVTNGAFYIYSSMQDMETDD
jgi:membrane fusion protein, heavy metal efflux system